MTGYPRIRAARTALPVTDLNSCAGCAGRLTRTGDAAIARLCDLKLAVYTLHFRALRANAELILTGRRESGTCKKKSGDSNAH
jgi:hypothetical protein